MKTNWRLLAEIVAVLSVLASLGMVWYELRLARSTSVGEYFSNDAERLQDLHSNIADHAVIWHAGCAGEELNPADQITFNQLVSMLEHHLFINYLGTSLDLSARPTHSISRAMARNMYLFPGFNKAVNEIWQMRRIGLGDRPLGRGGWENVVRAELEAMQSMPESPEIQLQMCGL